MTDGLDAYKEKLLGALDRCPQNINTAHVDPPLSPRVMQSIIDDMIIFDGLSPDDPIINLDFFRKGVMPNNVFPLFDRKDTNEACDEWVFDETFLDRLEARHDKVISTKDKLWLISTATFVDMPDVVSKVGRENVVSSSGIWFDKDRPAAMTPDDFLRVFEGLDCYVYGTWKSTPENLRWRAFIPTAYSMPVEVYWPIMGRCVEMLKQAGYGDVAASGLDSMVWRPESKIYLPCRPLDPSGAISIRVPGKPIDVYEWISSQCDRVLVPPPPAPLPSPVLSRLDIIRQRGAQQQQFKNTAGLKRAIIERWRSTPAGAGHAKFFALAASLAEHCGLSVEEAREILYAEHGTSRSNAADRLSEIDGVISAVQRKGLFSK